MFTRTHRIGRHFYTEALESYRDPDTGRPRHRSLARWRAERSFAEELGRTRWKIEQATGNIAYWQGIVDRTVRPRFPKHRKRAAENMAFWHRHLDIATAHLTALETARTAGLMAEDAEVEAAVRAEAARWRAITSSFPMLPHPRPPPELAGLADRVRRLAGQNDPDTMRTEIAAIAAALDALASPA